MRFFHFWRRQGAKIENAHFMRIFSIFDKIAIFVKIKCAFFSNNAHTSYWNAKCTFLLRSMDFQLSLEKKIKCVAILINFVRKFEIIHKIHFSSSFFGKSENLTKLQFFCSFFEITISPKWTSQMVSFDFKEPKIYF